MEIPITVQGSQGASRLGGFGRFGLERRGMLQGGGRVVCINNDGPSVALLA